MARHFPSCSAPSLGHGAEQLRLQDIFAFFVFLAGLVRLIVLPAHGFIALLAFDIPHNVSPRGHVPLHRFRLLDIDDRGEQEGLAMLAPEVPGYNVVEIGEMRLTILESSYRATGQQKIKQLG